MKGIINVLKPAGMSSAGVVYWLRKQLQTKKVGHIGTLDPGAAGVLPVCVGQATRLAQYYSAQDKTYRAEITFGIVTDTQDAYGTVIHEEPAIVTRNAMEEALRDFQGQIDQTPPMYSALRQQGKRLYEYARQGMVVDRPARPIHIDTLRLVRWQDEPYPRGLIEVVCSKGTYIRTLCHDIGRHLGCGAHMSYLLRTKVGAWDLASSWTLEEIVAQRQTGQALFLHKVGSRLPLPVIELLPSRLKAFRNGLATGSSNGINIPQNTELPPNAETTVQVICEGTFVGIGHWRGNCLYPSKVFQVEES